MNPVFRSRLEEDLSFDRLNGTDTDGLIQLHELKVSEEDCKLGNRYEPAHPWVVRDFFKHMPVRFDEYVFIDLGSGKGRALLLASHYPFQQIIGVELAEELHAVAVRNIEVYRAQGIRCRAVCSLCMGADSFVFPPQKLIISLFNSFQAEVLEKVVGNLTTSLAKRPREVYFVYVNPLFKHVIESTGIFKLIRKHSRYITYSFCPPIPAAAADAANAVALKTSRGAAGF